jgi:hypothetical protein
MHSLVTKQSIHKHCTAIHICSSCLIEEREAHVGILFLFLLLFGLLLGSSSTSSWGSSTSSSTSSWGSATGTNVDDEVLNRLLLNELGEEGWPVWLYLDTGRLGEGGNFVSLGKCVWERGRI